MSEKQVVGYDFTIFEKHGNFEKNDLQKKLMGWCKKWVFQLEKTSSGQLHYQGRVHLISQKRLCELVAQIPIKANWSVTSKGVHLGCNFNYVLKEDSRVEGPWRDDEYVEPPPLTRQLRAFMQCELRPWQVQVQSWCSEVDDRSIYLVHDKVGGAGKSIFAEYLEYKGIAFDMPSIRMMEDIMQFAMSFPVAKAYLVDMPRGMKKDKLGDFYAGLECLKNGVAYDKRYCGKRRRFDRPQIIVFTNQLPEWSLMSLDRWKVFEMTPTFELEPVTVHLSSDGAAL